MIQATEKTIVLPTEEKDYTITFSYADESNNTGFAYLDVHAINPAWVINGRAIDGYLKGSDVRFAIASRKARWR